MIRSALCKTFRVKRATILQQITSIYAVKSQRFHTTSASSQHLKAAIWHCHKKIVKVLSWSSSPWNSSKNRTARGTPLLTLFCSFLRIWSPWPQLLLLLLERPSTGGKRVGSYSAPSDINALWAIHYKISWVSVTFEGRKLWITDQFKRSTAPCK